MCLFFSEHDFGLIRVGGSAKEVGVGKGEVERAKLDPLHQN